MSLEPLRASTLEAYASAFEHPLMDEARRLVASHL
jgi:hypothetical protein